MKISDQTYLSWHNRLAVDKVFARFWIFCGIYAVGFFYAGLLLFFLPKFRGLATLAFLAFLFCRVIVCETIYFFYKKQRPYQRLNFSPPASLIFMSPLKTRPDSWPSGHAVCLAAISLVCLIFLPWLGVLGVIATIFICAGRVILGYHDISDILWGWFIGAVCVLITVPLTLYLALRFW